MDSARLNMIAVHGHSLALGLLRTRLATFHNAFGRRIIQKVCPESCSVAQSHDDHDS